MREYLNVKAIPAVLAKYPNATQTMIVCDSMSEYADLVSPYASEYGGTWQGNMSGRESLVALRKGDMAGAKMAESYLDKIQVKAPETQKWANILDVTGGSPNVPAYLAGHPMNMRNRKRMVSEQGPLAVIVDLTSSGAIDAEDVQRRGCAILALVQILLAVRPVELWALVGLGKRDFAAEIVTKIDTMPLDLARAAHMLTHPSVSRGLGYSYLESKHRSGGSWNFCDIKLHRETSRESLLRFIPTATDVLYIPPVYYEDDKIKEPDEWLTKMIAQYGGAIEEAA